MTTTGRDPGPPWLRTRVVLVLFNALLNGLFAHLFAYVWTDELVDGSPYAIADPVGTGIEGALAGLLPVIFGLGLCIALVSGAEMAWMWPVVLVMAAGGVGAILGASARFAEGMPAACAAILVPVVLTAAVGLVANAQSRRRQIDAEA